MEKININVRQYTLKDFNLWDRFVSNSRNGTLLHTRSFLSYHGGKFEDLSLIFEDDKGNIIGIFPSAIDLQQRDIVVSHPGITYGGIVHNGCLRGEKMLYALQSMMCKYQEEGFHSIRYKAIPYIYHQVPTSDDLYAIFLVGGVCYRKDLSSTIDIANRPKLSKGRRYFLRKAEKSCIMVKDGYQYLEDFWTILTDNLAGKYDAKPLHSLAEIQSLFKMFPDSIKCLVAIKDAQVVAGTVIFQTRQVIHTQYLATNQKGRDISALDLIIESSILEAKKQGIRYFNFGTSTEQDGSLNTNLYQYKSEFGSGGVVHEFYEIDIRK